MNLWAWALCVAVLARIQARNIDPAVVKLIKSKVGGQGKLPAKVPVRSASSDRQLVSDFLTVISTDTSGTVETPNYPGEYPTLFGDTVTITVLEHMIIKLTFVDFHLENDDQCSYDALAVYDGATDREESLGVFCGEGDPHDPQVLFSTGRYMLLSFSSDVSGTDTGFHLEWEAILPGDQPYPDTVKACSADMPAVLSGLGELVSPGIPDDYPNFAYCAWIITADTNKHVLLQFTSFDIEQTEGRCDYDWLSVYEYDTATGELGDLRETLCGHNLPSDLISYGNGFALEFSSDESHTGRGFVINYNSTNQDQSYLPTSSCPGPQEVRLTDAVTISSPGFHEGAYPNDADCSWLVLVPEGKFINVEFLSLAVEWDSSCNNDKVAIYEAQNRNGLLRDVFCGYDRPLAFHSSTDHLFIHFTSNSLTTDPGFQLVVSQTDVPGALTEDMLACPGPHVVGAGTILSPGFQFHQPYVNKMDCRWMVTVTEGKLVRLEFLYLDLEPSCGCWFDQIKVWDGLTHEAELLGIYCGSDPPSAITSSSNTLDITFHTSPSVTAWGFEILITETDAPVDPDSVDVSPCPGPVSVDPSTGVIASSNFGTGSYNNDQICTWRLTTEEGKCIALSFHVFRVEGHDSCSYDRLTIYDGADDTALSYTLCGEDLPPNFVSTGRDVFIVFTSDGTVTDEGFYITSTLSNVPGTIPPVNNILSSPGPQHISLPRPTTSIYWPPYEGGSYGNNARNSWLVEAPLDMFLHVHFVFLDVEYDSDCSYDSVTIIDGPSSINYVRARVCGTEMPADFVTETRLVLIQFESDHSGTGSGFHLELMAVPRTWNDYIEENYESFYHGSSSGSSDYESSLDSSYYHSSSISSDYGSSSISSDYGSSSISSDYGSSSISSDYGSSFESTNYESSSSSGDYEKRSKSDNYDSSSSSFDYWSSLVSLDYGSSSSYDSSSYDSSSYESSSYDSSSYDSSSYESSSYESSSYESSSYESSSESTDYESSTESTGYDSSSESTGSESSSEINYQSSNYRSSSESSLKISDHENHFETNSSRAVINALKAANEALKRKIEKMALKSKPKTIFEYSE